jgi:hypothetical protein
LSRFDALVGATLGPEAETPQAGSPLGKLMADRERIAAKHGPDSEVVKQFDMRIRREAEGAGDNNAFASERQLRQEFTALEGDFREVDTSFKRLQSVAAKPSPAGDLALIFNYMKMLDPRSTVREGEFQSAAAAKPLLERLGVGFEPIKMVWEGKSLTPEQRQDFINQAGAIRDAATGDQARLRERYSGLAERHGLSPENIVGPERIGGVIPAEAVKFLRENANDENVRRQFQEKFGIPARLYLQR